jgi:hypothetical protein
MANLLQVLASLLPGVWRVVVDPSNGQLRGKTDRRTEAAETADIGSKNRPSAVISVLRGATADS